MQDEVLRRSLSHALVRAFRGVNRSHNRALAPIGITAEQAHILLLLWLESPLKMGELMRHLMLSSGTLTGAIDRMEQAGLVRRARDPGDGRAFLVEPARAAPRTRDRIEAAVSAAEEMCFGALTSRERQELLRLLEKVVATLS